MIRQREFIASLDRARPLPALAQQHGAEPLAVYLQISSPDVGVNARTAVRKGLGETGYIEGRKIAIEPHWAENQFDTLPALAADLIRPPGGNDFRE